MAWGTQCITSRFTCSSHGIFDSMQAFIITITNSDDSNIRMVTGICPPVPVTNEVFSVFSHLNSNNENNSIPNVTCHSW